MILDSQKCYYAIIPADVRYDENLIPSAKLLYGEITALCNEKGYCWATNDYFSRLYSVSKKTISTWIKSLSDSGYISLQFVRNDDEKQTVVRLIRIAGSFCVPITKTSIPLGRKLHDPHNEKVTENNTMNNTFNNSSSQVRDRTGHNAFEFDGESESMHAEENCDGGVKKQKIFDADSDPYQLADFLEREIAKNNPKFPQSEQQRQRWAKDIDLMLRRDKIEADDIAAVIDWCQKDKFWCSNILSGKKLREKYQQLRMRMTANRR